MDNEIRPISVDELKDKIGDVDLTTKKPDEKQMTFGPGHINLASPELGYLSDCAAIAFPDVGAEMTAKNFNYWAENNPLVVVLKILPLSSGILVIYNTAQDDTTAEEKRVASIAFEDKLNEFRAMRKKEKEAEAQEKELKLKEAAELQMVGRHCAEVHHAEVQFMRGRTKNQRKTLADKLIVWAKSLEKDEKVLKEFNEIVKQYVKEGIE